MRGLCLVVLSILVSSADASVITLGTAGSFAVLAATTVTNTGSSVVTGNLGVFPGTAITGFPPGIVTSAIYSAGAVPMQAQKDLTTAYNAAASQSPTRTLTGQDLGGLTLMPGVYFFASSAGLTGQLTLDAHGDPIPKYFQSRPSAAVGADGTTTAGDPNAVFVFQIGSTLTTASAASVLLENDAQGGDVFWQVGSSATLGTTTVFAGDILASASITLNQGASIVCGGAFAQTGAVTMDTNTVTSCASTAGNSAPEPSSSMLLGMGLLFGLIGWKWRSRRSE